MDLRIGDFSIGFGTWDEDGNRVENMLLSIDIMTGQVYHPIDIFDAYYVALSNEPF